jgi:hypothetical protein
MLFVHIVVSSTYCVFCFIYLYLYVANFSGLSICLIPPSCIYLYNVNGVSYNKINRKRQIISSVPIIICSILQIK